MRTSDPFGEDAPSIGWDVAERCLPGQGRSGDRCAVMTHDGNALIGVIDGLGHGAAAADAAETASAVLERYSHEDVITLMRRCHQALLQTRGAAILLVAYCVSASSISWVGVGNVDGLLLRHTVSGTKKSRMLMRGGVVGYKLPPLRAGTTAIERGDLLVVATDGISAAFSEDLPIPGTPRHIAHTILTRFAKDTDDALVLVARFGGER